MFLHNMNFRLKISSKFMLCSNIQNSGNPFYTKSVLFLEISCFSFIGLFLKENISVNFGTLHDEKTSELLNFLLFAETFFWFVCFLCKYLNFTKNSSFLLGVGEEHQKFRGNTQTRRQKFLWQKYRRGYNILFQSQ